MNSEFIRLGKSIALGSLYGFIIAAILSALYSNNVVSFIGWAVCSYIMAFLLYTHEGSKVGPFANGIAFLAVASTFSPVLKPILTSPLFIILALLFIGWLILALIGGS